METTKPDNHKFFDQAEISYKDVFEFAFCQYFIPLMRKLAEEIGEEQFLEMVKKAASDMGAERVKAETRDLPKKDLSVFFELFAAFDADPLWNHALTSEVVEHNEKAFELKVTECLWAKTFREANASNLGYAAICHPDFAYACAFHPKLRMIRDKTLMQGDDYCNHRYVWEE